MKPTLLLLAAGIDVYKRQQYALAAIFKAASDGTYRFREETREYARRASKLKEIFLRHNFHIVYDHDLGAVSYTHLGISLANPLKYSKKAFAL